MEKSEVFAVREAYRKVPKTVNGRIPVIVKTSYGMNHEKYYVGVQFWTEEMIEKKTSTNADESISKFIEAL